MSSADNTERATRRNLYDLYVNDIALLGMSVRSAIRPSCEDKSIFLAGAALLYETKRTVSRSSFVVHMDALLSWTYLKGLFQTFEMLGWLLFKHGSSHL